MPDDDIIQLYRSLSESDWSIISTYARLATWVDGVTNIRHVLLASLNNNAPVDDTDNIS